jgi:hypothetical protein
VEVEAAGAAEREERLADPLPEEERDHHVHVLRRGAVQLLLGHERQAVALRHEVHALLIAGERVGLRRHDGRHLGALRDEPLEGARRGALALGEEDDPHATSSR